jgi:hypothetical protein
MGTDVYSAGGYTQLADPSQWDITPEDSNTVGNATAIGLSIQGISAAQLNQLKTRLEQTKTQLQAQNFTGLTGEQVSGDLLTATLWSWFAAAESHNRLSQTQANMVEMPGLSYGLFHAVANPVFNWGVVTKVTFPGVNMDIGHVRNPSWSKSNDESQWANYNRLRGQYMSALEHAVPERFFSDPAQCNLVGTANPQPGLPNCPQGISAVKAIQIAAQAGQRIYTITPEVFQNNPNIVSSQLNQHSADTQDRVQNYLQAGYEVNIHQSPITQDGWSGAGFIVIDQATGAGAYLIEGGSNGAWIPVAAITFTMLALVLGPLLGALFVGSVGFFGAVSLIAGVYYGLTQYIKYVNSVIDNPTASVEQKQQLIAVVSILSSIASIFAYFKAGGDASSAALGLFIGALNSSFKSLRKFFGGYFDVF